MPPAYPEQGRPFTHEGNREIMVLAPHIPMLSLTVPADEEPVQISLTLQGNVFDLSHGGNTKTYALTGEG